MKKFELLLANIVFGFLIVASITALFICLAPANVLKDWRVSVPPGPYKPGDEVSLTTTSTKIRKANGRAHRAIECNVGKDSTVAYPLVDYEAKALPGYIQGHSNIVLPNISNRPATCRLIITIDYRVYGLRHTYEYAASNDFVVN